jgi:hypothetical protein
MSLSPEAFPAELVTLIADSLDSKTLWHLAMTCKDHSNTVQQAIRVRERRGSLVSELREERLALNSKIQKFKAKYAGQLVYDAQTEAYVHGNVQLVECIAVLNDLRSAIAAFEKEGSKADFENAKNLILKVRQKTTAKTPPASQPGCCSFL